MMGLFNRPPKEGTAVERAAAASARLPTGRCEACRRDPRVVERRVVEGEVMDLCVDSANCNLASGVRV